ncbi:MAG: HEPN domain-containing protein [Chitinispirillales bacterium]|jgi:HEPN domain-containing protein|nr:HEPN domain-containing protein [Chitinispirillales bacterium]
MTAEYVAEWFSFADMSLASAEFLCGMHPQPLEIICYHCQQSAEKYLKGYLIHNGIMEPPKTHNLDNLCELCFDFDDCFKEIEVACNILTAYGVQPRYPNEMEIFEYDMLKALEYARKIRDFNPLAKLRSILSKNNSNDG